MKTQEITVKTSKKKQVVDITEDISQKLKELKIQDGLCHLFLLHTTACITCGDLDPGTDLDILDALENLLPKINWRHPHNPAHVPDHINSSIIGPSLLLPFKAGTLILGTWQRVLLIELDGPRDRKLIFSIIED